MITLENNDIHSKIIVQPNSLPYKEGSKIPGRYHRAIYDNKVFTVSESFYDEWKRGDIAILNLTEGTREIKDDAGEVVDVVPTLTYAGHANWNQVTNVKRRTAELMAIDLKAKAMAHLDENTLKELQDAM